MPRSSAADRDAPRDDAPATPTFDRISAPADLKALSIAELTDLAAEIRGELIRVVSNNGGHLGASLGTVELAIALHYVFASPRDRIVWDVGHQAYVHKLLTGRRDRFPTIRQEGGLSGFLSRDESEHDAFGAGHASTSISAALGMAVAFHRTGQGDRRVVAVIGDGALTGGMAFEALNNAGILNLPFLVVLNDNEMSIAPNVGAISRYLDRVRTDRRYNRAKDELARNIGRLPQGDLLVELGKRWKDSVKEFVYHAQIWEELGFTYVGPVDGHDLRDLIDALHQVRNVEGPAFLHVVTAKGRGFDGAEQDRERVHAVSAPAPPGAPPSPPKYQDVFARTLIDLAAADPRVVAITAAMPTGTSLARFQAAYPDRFFDVGIAEQHAVTFAAGLAAGGQRPVAAIYSTFLQRAYDQIAHDVCLQRLPVVFALDRAGFAGDDGRTHHGIYDLSYLRCLPNMTIVAPKDENELRHLLKTALEHDSGPVAIRYPRGAGVGVAMDEPLHALPYGRAEVLQEGDDVAIVAVGAMVLPAERAADRLRAVGISTAVINARFVKPLDEATIVRFAERCGAIVTVEENAVAGGFGAAVLELLAARGLAIPVATLGVPDRVFEHAPQARLREKAGLTPDGIVAVVNDLLTRHSKRPAIALANRLG
ncbi:MAG: 1-deoxy-D-xylulose-5-phosphate synthase [Thermomicrobiales bacterium]|nr:1-deoxy-D-xylulose-5-phosphate synthase [Thermomicrobiales bacterium]